MTIEEKAKAYDEALERARALNSGKDVDVKAGTTTCEYIFPELKETEDDRMRKKLIAFLKSYNTLETSRYISWLEKQDNPKFINIDVDAMVKAYKERITNGANSPLIDTYLTVFRRGVENTLDELKLRSFINKSKEND